MYGTPALQTDASQNGAGTQAGASPSYTYQPNLSFQGGSLTPLQQQISNLRGYQNQHNQISNPNAQIGANEANQDQQTAQNANKQASNVNYTAPTVQQNGGTGSVTGQGLLPIGAKGGIIPVQNFAQGQVDTSQLPSDIQSYLNSLGSSLSPLTSGGQVVGGNGDPLAQLLSQYQNVEGQLPNLEQQALNEYQNQAQNNLGQYQTGLASNQQNSLSALQNYLSNIDQNVYQPAANVGQYVNNVGTASNAETNANQANQALAGGNVNAALTSLLGKGSNPAYNAVTQAVMSDQIANAAGQANQSNILQGIGNDALTQSGKNYQQALQNFKTNEANSQTGLTNNINQYYNNLKSNAGAQQFNSGDINNRIGGMANQLFMQKLTPQLTSALGQAWQNSPQAYQQMLNELHNSGLSSDVINSVISGAQSSGPQFNVPDHIQGILNQPLSS